MFSQLKKSINWLIKCFSRIYWEEHGFRVPEIEMLRKILEFGHKEMRRKL
jgi:hypothetical protein